MKRLRALADEPVSRPLTADEVMEFHAARLLLLFRHCGVDGQRIDGLTKMAKLDFFVRYPSFFAVAAASAGHQVTARPTDESRMVRYRYGPWDDRYYQILAYLEAVGLILVDRRNNSLQLELTQAGIEIAEELTREPAFESLIRHMQEVTRVFGAKSGTRLKNMIYELFEKEVGQRSLGEVIE